MSGSFRAVLLAACGLLLAGCFTENLVEVADADGSNDHRVFRVASVTKVLMEPVLWRLEDSELINFDNPVTVYFKGTLPPEFETVTLRDLHDNKSGLPREFVDPWCLGDVFDAFKCGLVGSNLYASFDTREGFLVRLWHPCVRGDVRRRVPRYSNMGYALLLMAICDELGTTPEALLQKYLVGPYGLQETSFERRTAFERRLTPACAGHLPWLRLAGTEVPEHREGEVTLLAGGLYSSASDILKVCYVILPHLDRAKGLLEERRLACGRTVYYRFGMIYGGNSFVGFDPVGGHAAVVLKNQTCWNTDEGFDLLESLASPPEGI